MKILITGICGFVGSTLAHALIDALPGCQIAGLDNFIRAGSEGNRAALCARGVRLQHGDVRNASDLETLPPVDWVIDAASMPERAGRCRWQIQQPAGRGAQSFRHGQPSRILPPSRCGVHPPEHQPRVRDRVASRGCPWNPVERAYPIEARHALLPPGVSVRGIDEAVQYRRADLALRRDQAGFRDVGARIRRNLRLPCMDQPVRRAGRGPGSSDGPTRGFSPTGSTRT